MKDQQTPEQFEAACNHEWYLYAQSNQRELAKCREELDLYAQSNQRELAKCREELDLLIAVNESLEGRVIDLESENTRLKNVLGIEEFNDYYDTFDKN